MTHECSSPAFPAAAPPNRLLALIAPAALSLAALAGCAPAPQESASAPARGDAAAASAAEAKQPTEQEKIARGAHLAEVSVCGDCHSPGGLYGAEDRSRYLGGSDVAWSGPWGYSYADNLTFDVETGIGSWSEDDFIKAMRTGVRPNGEMLRPPMPWPRYAHHGDDDLRAIYAFLKSLPHVKHEVPADLPPGPEPGGGVASFPAPPAWDMPALPGSLGGPPGSPAGPAGATAPAGG